MEKLNELALFATNTARLSKGISFGPVVTSAQIISVTMRHPCYMRSLSDGGDLDPRWHFE